MNKNLIAHLALLGAMIIYGANYAISKKVTPEFIGPYGLVFYRVAFSVVLFALIDFLFIPKKMEKKDILYCALLGLFGVAINQMLFLKGLSMTLPINSSVMMITTPVFVVVLMIFMRHEKPGLLRITGILLGFGGALLFITQTTAKPVSGMQASLTGDILTLINAMSWGIFLILAKKLSAKYHPVTLIKWVFFFGLIYVTPFAWDEAMSVNFKDFSNETWMNFMYVVFMTTFLAYLLNMHALIHLSSSVVAVYIYLQPLLAAFFGILWGMDVITTEKIIYAVIVFTGVYLAGRQPRKI